MWAIDASSRHFAFVERIGLRVVLFKPYPLFGTTRAEKKCAASPGGTFFILLPDLALSTQRTTS
jgi:hypothetical protein